MQFSQKAAVVSFISNEPVFCLADFYYGRAYSWLVTLVGVNPIVGTEYFVYDLGVAAEALMALTDEQLVARLARSQKPIRSLKANASPILTLPDTAPSGTSGAELDVAELERRTDLLRSDAALRKRLITAAQLAKAERTPSTHVEQKIYEGFTTAADQKVLGKFHGSRWEDRPTIVASLADARLRELGTRLIHHERPDVLDADTRSAHDKAMAQRIIETAADIPWLTIPKAMKELAVLMESATAEERMTFEACQPYLAERQQAARALTS